MISKLKRKFIILATVSMFVLMAVLVTIMNLINYSVVVKESDVTLDILSQPNFPFSEKEDRPDKPQKDTDHFIPRGMSPEVPYESRFFSVSVTADGTVTESDFSKILSVDDTSVAGYIEKAMKSGGDRGFVGQFRYVKIFGEQKTRILFLDCGRKLDAFYAFLRTSLGVGVLGCVIVFFAFLFVSGKIVKPIAESYEKQKRFVSDAGHEIKTPLTIINANLDLLESGGGKEELEEVRTQTKRLTELTNNLVYLSKMEESEHKLRKVELPLSDIADETAGSFRVLAASKHMDFFVQIQPGITAKGAPDAIRRLISILLENAVKYTPDGGSVTMNLSVVRRTAILSVVNTTEDKIIEGELPYVFDRFYRSDTSRNSATGGHGIGLSIAKAVVEAHEGTITASTKSGAEFCVTVTIPL